MKKYYVYIILTKDNTYYCGYTDDVEKRFKTHLMGYGAKYTKAHKPVKVIFSKEFDTKNEAMREEIRIKKMTRKQKEEYIKKKGLV